MWISYHLFMWDITKFDDLLREVFLNFENNKIINYFFIRYWEGGPHIRIRVKQESNVTNKLVYQCTKRSIDNFFLLSPDSKNVYLDKNDFYLNNFTDGIKVNPNKMPWYKNGDIVSIDYIPEIQRYGGINLIQTSEQAFICSSALVKDLLYMEPTTKKKLFLLFAVFNKIAISIFKDNTNDLELFIQNSKKFWDDFHIDPINIKIFDKEKFWDYIFEISSKLVLLDSFNNFLNKLQSIYFYNGISLKYKRSIIFSQFHMFANRLGVPISFELFFYNLKEKELNFNE